MNSGPPSIVEIRTEGGPDGSKRGETKTEGESACSGPDASCGRWNRRRARPRCTRHAQRECDARSSLAAGLPVAGGVDVAWTFRERGPRGSRRARGPGRRCGMVADRISEGAWDRDCHRPGGAPHRSSHCGLGRRGDSRARAAAWRAARGIAGRVARWVSCQARGIAGATVAGISCPWD